MYRALRFDIRFFLFFFGIDNSGVNNSVEFGSRRGRGKRDGRGGGTIWRFPTVEWEFSFSFSLFFFPASFVDFFSNFLFLSFPPNDRIYSGAMETLISFQIFFPNFHRNYPTRFFSFFLVLFVFFFQVSSRTVAGCSKAWLEREQHFFCFFFLRVRLKKRNRELRHVKMGRHCVVSYLATKPASLPFYFHFCLSLSITLKGWPVM